MSIEIPVTNSTSPHLPLGSDEVVSRFRQGLERLAEIGRIEGLSLVPYKDPSLPLFCALPESQRTELVEVLNAYVEVMESTLTFKESVRFNLNSVWRMLSRLRLRPCSRLFDALEPTDVVEIYTMSGLQIFRSFHFFEVCSYALEDLFCIPWYGLFSRPEPVDQAYFEAFRRMLSGNHLETERVPIEPHEVRERFGPRSFVTRAEPRWGAPLFSRDGQVRGMVHAFRAQKLSSDQ